MGAGQVRVAWHPQGMEEVVSDRKVHLADRSLMPGDVVRRLLVGRKTQMGYCKDVKVYTSAQIIGTTQVGARLHGGSQILNVQLFIIFH